MMLIMSVNGYVVGTSLHVCLLDAMVFSTIPAFNATLFFKGGPTGEIFLDCYFFIAI